MDTVLIIFLFFIQVFIFGFLRLPQSSEPTTQKQTIVHTSDPKHFSYEGETGPEYWGDITPEYITCKTGSTQTPVDIETAKVIQVTSKNFTFRYSPSKLHVLNNGHTIQVNYDPGSYVDYENNTYQLVQFHFHVPSEHTINGRAWPMNVHFVHKNAQNELLVVEVLFTEGVSSPVLSQIFASIPAEGKTVDMNEIINASDLLPKDIAYYHYSGSLTTPPCTEGVRWFIMSTPIAVGAEQIGIFKHIYPLNARPIQPLNGRIIEKN